MSEHATVKDITELKGFKTKSYYIKPLIIVLIALAITIPTVSSHGSLTPNSYSIGSTPQSSMTSTNASSSSIPRSSPVLGTAPIAAAGTPTPAPSSPGTHLVTSTSSAMSASGRAHVGGATAGTASTRSPARAVQPLISNVGYFVGINGNCPNCGGAPPDVSLAAGQNEVVEIVNLEVGIWNKQGTNLGMFSAAGFFATGTDTISDPRVLYDAGGSGRFFASITDVTTHSIHLAVAQQSSAIGNWWVYFINDIPNGDYGDQPGLGISATVVALATSVFNGADSFVGGMLWAIDKNGLLSGGTTYWNYWGPCHTIFGSCWPAVMPVLTTGPATTTTQYYISTGQGNTGTATLFSIPAPNGIPNGQTLLTESSTDIGIIYDAIPPSAKQQGSNNNLRTDDGRVLGAVWLANNLWFSFNSGCTPQGDSTVRSCYGIIEINTSNNSVTQQAEYGTNGYYFFYPAVTVDPQNDMTVVVGFSSANNFPSLAAYGQAFTAPQNTLDAGITMAAGTAPAATNCNPDCRYGDYFGASPDPVSYRMYVAGEFMDTSAIWNTDIHTISPAITITIVAYPTNDIYSRSQGIAIDRTLPVPWWPPYQSGYEFMITSNSFQYRTTLQLAAGTHTVQYAASGSVPNYAWQGTIYVNGATVASGLCGRNQILSGSFTV